jgi:carbon-monoxide dehydrogenase medium subunit
LACNALMKPAPFKYVLARSLEEALAAKSEYGDESKFLAGGQSLIAMMNFRLVQPAVLIDINPLTELDGLRLDANGAMRIGALTRYRTIQRDVGVSTRQPLIAESIPFIAHPQIRNRGTIGGSLAHADPAAELPAVIVALGGRMRVQSSKSERWIEADDFFRGIMSTALEPDEILLEIDVPAALPGTGTCFMEVARRRGDFALAGVAATVTIEDGACIHASLAFCSLGERPVNARTAAQVLIGTAATETAIDAAAKIAQELLEPTGNIHAGREFQRHLAGVLTRRALRSAAQRAESREGNRRPADVA